jgi:hypothetical protein
VLPLVVNRVKASRDLAQAVLAVAARDHSRMESAGSVIQISGLKENKAKAKIKAKARKLI